ncbi:uncharacterized protein LOC118414229 isoform X2 [Branchiostoma floridae]|uniref:Uncharacterized protein LOC118414229 isoform X2 n=1 Tax=Branchiostoma floridae TaxID=7739 RepID=A0A9J7L188_BRAFL|nr:uncharacterized protein LOC118414229 isoform X2 [Branchiostoma floridae]
MATLSKEDVRSSERNMKQSQGGEAATSFSQWNLQYQLVVADRNLAICELEQEKNRSAQKDQEIMDLKMQVEMLKAGGVCSSCQDTAEAKELYEFQILELEFLLEEQKKELSESRADLEIGDKTRGHISLEEAEAMAYRITELEALLEKQRNENDVLTARLQLMLSDDTVEQENSFLHECFLARCASLTDDEEERQTAYIEQDGPFLPECFLAHTASHSNDEEGDKLDMNVTQINNVSPREKSRRFVKLFRSMLCCYSRSVEEERT